MKDSLCHILAWHRGWAATLLVHGLLLGAGCGTSTEEPFEASDGGAEDTPSDGAEDLRGELTRDTQDAGLVNLCGGRAPLIHEGIPSDPGTECGCGGFLVCQGIDDLATDLEVAGPGFVNVTLADSWVADAALLRRAQV